MEAVTQEGESSGHSRLAELSPQETLGAVGGCPILGEGTAESTLTLQTYGQSPALPHTCCVTKDMWLALAGLRFSPVRHGHDHAVCNHRVAMRWISTIDDSYM